MVAWIAAVGAGVLVPLAMLPMVPFISRSGLRMWIANVLGPFAVVVVAPATWSMVSNFGDSHMTATVVIGAVGVQSVIVVAAIRQGKERRIAALSKEPSAASVSEGEP